MAKKAFMQSVTKKLKKGMKTGISQTDPRGFAKDTASNTKSKAGKLK